MSQSLRSLDEGGGEEEVQLDEFPAVEVSYGEKKYQSVIIFQVLFLHRMVNYEITVQISNIFTLEVSKNIDITKWFH